MASTLKTNTFFTPEDLKEMQRELNDSAVETETLAEREARALAILARRQASDLAQPSE